MRIGIVTSGDRDLVAAIGRIKANSERRLGQAVVAGAQVIQHAARENVFGADWLPPRDLRQVARRTGRLKRSIGVELESSVPGSATARVIADTPYAAYVEFGTSRMPPRSYLRKAIREHSDRVLNVMRDYAHRIIGLR